MTLYSNTVQCGHGCSTHTPRNRGKSTIILLAEELVEYLKQKDKVFLQLTVATMCPKINIARNIIFTPESQNVFFWAKTSDLLKS